MRNISTAWYRFIQIVAFAAAIGLGVMWLTHRTSLQPSANRASPERYAPASTGAMTGNTNRSHNSSATRPPSIWPEFTPQSALFLGANELVRYHPSVFTDMVRAAHDNIPIFGFVNDDYEANLGRELLNKAGLPSNAIHFVKHPLDTMWVRDYGPLFVRTSDEKVKIVHATYNMPDEKTGPRTRDAEFAAYIGRVLHLEVEDMPLVIEGGNLMANGHGVIVTSTRVFDRTENSHYAVPEIGQLLHKHLGCLSWGYVRPMEGEQTGHIDLCLTFLRSNLAVVGRYDKAYDPVNAAILDEMANTVAGQTSAGQMIVERIPMPPRTEKGDWRSYCNVLMINGVILMPSYTGVDPAMEAEAVATYTRLMPSWKVVPILSDTLIEKRGVLHCVGITVPKYVNVEPLIGEAF